MAQDNGKQILQIMPAEGWFAAFNDMETGEQVYAPLVCWALGVEHSAQFITGMVIAEKRVIACAEDANFSHYLHRAELEMADHDEG